MKHLDSWRAHLENAYTFFFFTDTHTHTLRRSLDVVQMNWEKDRGESRYTIDWRKKADEMKKSVDYSLCLFCH